MKDDMKKLNRIFNIYVQGFGKLSRNEVRRNGQRDKNEIH